MTRTQREAVLCRRRSTGAAAAVAILIIVTLAGCGFHLRGSQQGAVTLPPVYLGGPLSAEMRELLRQMITSGGGQVTADREAATMAVQFEGESVDKRVLSVSVSGKIQEYELHYALSFEVKGPDGEVWAPSQSIHRLRDFSYDDTDVIAKAEEEAQLIIMMRREVAAEILRRLHAVAVRAE